MFYCLLAYRKPLYDINKSPSEILNRLLRTVLPVVTELLMFMTKSGEKQNMIKQNYDKTAKNGSVFKKGDNVLLKIKDFW